ncbi:MAG: CDP-alcohol phosphatidyltransferase family protein [Candidatus Thermoplasmatota archaeon]|nr:CDP-alcohol phosphatidyltransferase family protein [Candidatus Thermoplasmatota archaeon]
METGNEYFTVPNVLSASRIIFLPLLFLVTHIKLDLVFLALYIVIGSTDYFDGILARKLKQTSEFGKTIDSVADLFFYLGTLAFIYLWFPYIVDSLTNLLLVFFVFFLSSFAVSWIKIGKPILMHTNLLRLNAALVFFLVIVSFLTDFGLGDRVYPIYFGTVILFIYILAFTEEMLIFLFYGDVDRDTRFIWELWGKSEPKK